jgi:hypothetical protein
MKKLRILPLLLSLFFLFSCEKIKEVLNLKFDIETEVSTYRWVSIGPDDPLTIDDTFVINAADDWDIQDNLDKLDGYSVKRIYLIFSGYDGDVDITFTGTVKLGDVSVSVSNLNVAALANSMPPDEYDLPISQSDLEKLAADLDADNQLQGSIVGSATDKPVSFAIEIWAELVVTVEK